MTKSILLFLLLGVSSLSAENVKNLQKLESEKKALELKLQAYTLKKKIIEMENFFKKEKLEKEEKIARKRALIKFKNDLRANRHRRGRTPYTR